MKVRGMGQLTLNMCFGPNRSLNVKVGYNKACLAAALATENDVKRSGGPPPDNPATSAHTDGNTMSGIILKQEGQ